MSQGIVPGLELDRAALDRARISRDARFDGRFFVSVISTGIYCRPICPTSKGRLRKVRYYATAAAAAEAGCRPCLRCRPEAAPASPAWRGASAVVGRALRLIDDGLLNGESVEGLASRLGIGPRHLRRLFLQHVGASPGAIAQTRRLHFAKRLIDETDLSMMEVALEAGYGSLRRFNAAFREAYWRTPSDLRRHRRRPVLPSGKENGIRLRLAYRPPYDWRSTLEFLAARAVPEIERIDGDRYSRTIVQDGTPARVTLRPATDGDALLLELSEVPPRSLLKLTERARRVFDLSVDPLSIEGAFRDDRLLGPLIRECPGLRIPGAWNGFECAVRAVLSQGSPATERRLVSRLVRSFGSRFPDTGTADGTLTHIFPTGQALAAGRLDGIGLAGPQIATVHALAEALLTRRIDFEGPAGELIERLVALPGLNESTAHYIAMRALGEPDTFPYSDADHGGSARLAAQRHRRGALTNRTEEWRPWRSYAALHLWRADGMKPEPAAVAGSPASSDRLAAGCNSAERYGRCSVQPDRQDCAPATGLPSTYVSPSARQR